MSYILDLGKRAKAAEQLFIGTGIELRNTVLEMIAKGLEAGEESIVAQNAEDLKNAEKNGKSSAFIDRLCLNPQRIRGIADDIRGVIAQSDPIGEVIGGGDTKNGLSIIKKRVPLGIIGIIYESRPNVTVDSAVLCLKSGNVCILRGGSDSINSNRCLVRIIQNALEKCGLSPDCVLLVEDTRREIAAEMMKLNGYIDVLIPRGSASLINTVVENSTVPVIETGAGNCHIYVDEFADIDKAVKITDNAKTQRPSVCNAAETLLVHEKAAEKFLKALESYWNGMVKLYGDSETSKFIKTERIATEEDYFTEYNDLEMAVRVVKNLDEAVSHINKYGTRHSEAIITENYGNAQRFQLLVDAAAVYVNASTRFTDGSVFGLGAEIGISNQKLHARGPMGLKELTTYKYLINGNGQIR